MDVEPAPYGTFMAQHLVDEQAKQEKLKQQAVEVSVNGQLEVLRPEAIFLKGVDALSTDNIKGYVDYYINYQIVSDEPRETPETMQDDGASSSSKFQPLPFEEVSKFKVQWINDSSVNIVFDTHEQAKHALAKLSITSSNPSIAPIPESEESVNELIHEREAKPYNPTIEFQQHSNLANRLGLTNDKLPDEATMDEDEVALTMFTRMSLQSDRKVKNASAQSRYYLIHGEPERKPKYRSRPNSRGGRGGRGGRSYDNSLRSRNRDRDYDLFASKMQSKDDEEEDLFAEKLKNRDRSPTRD